MTSGVSSAAVPVFDDDFRPLSGEQAALFELNPNPVLVLDRHFRVRYINAATAIYGGIDRESLIGEHIWSRYPHLKGTIFEHAYRGVLRDGLPVSFEEQNPAMQRWQAVHAYPADDSIVAILEDITDRRQAEMALADSELMLARAQALASIGSWAIHANPQRIRLSDEAYRLIGLTPGQSIDLGSLRQRLRPGERAELLDELTRSAPAGDSRMTLEFRRFDDQIVFLDVLVRLSTSDAPGDLQMFGTIQDVTARVTSSEALRRSEEMLRLAQEAANVGSFDHDLRTGLTHWSDQMRRVVGLGPHDPTHALSSAESGYAFIHPEDRPQVRAAIERTHETGEKQELRMRVVTIDGTTKYMLGNAILVRDAHGIPAHVVGTALDISEQVAADAERARLESQIQQAQKLESLGVLAGGIAHDFNNLLVGILGNASLALLELDETHHARESISSIERAAQRAAELTRQLLAYAGKGRFVVEPIDVSAAVKEMSSLLRTAVSRTASMQLDLAKHLPAIEVDTTQFRQVLMNLITNASDALRDDAGMISLRTGVRDVDRDFLTTCIVGSNATPGHYVFVEVQDSGVGMDEATLARIFDPFFSTKFTGRGLGLAATLGIVRSHNGAIHVHSAVGEGTSFTVLFPVSDRSAHVHVTPRASSWHGRGEVLVIDDEPSVLAIIATLLTRRGFAVTKANDGAQGIELYGADPSRFALVLLDMTMPGLDGQTVLRALRALDRDVRVLLMSGYNEQEVSQMLAGPSPAGFLQKPFRADELYDRVARALELNDAWSEVPPAHSTGG